MYREQRHAKEHGESTISLISSKIYFRGISSLRRFDTKSELADKTRNRHRKRAQQGVGLAGDNVGDVARGLGGKKNAVGGIVQMVSDGLDRGAGKNSCNLETACTICGVGKNLFR